MSKLLREVGEALYGPRWQTDIAPALGVTSRHVRRWAADDPSMPDGKMVDLLRLCEERTTRIDAVIEKLRVAMTS